REQEQRQCRPYHFGPPFTGGRCVASRSPSIHPYSSNSTSRGRRRRGNRTVNGRENTDGFSTVASYSSVSFAVSRNRSTTVAPAPTKLPASCSTRVPFNPRTSTTSVSPSQWPRESPFQDE